MKLHSFLIEITVFSAVLCVFILPQVFSSPACNFSWNFPYMQILYAFFAAGLLRCHGKSANGKSTEGISTARGYGKMRFVTESAGMWLAFGELCVTSALIQLAVFFLGDKSSFRAEIFPETPRAFLFCLIGFACSAFYEEAVFRVFLPESAKNIFSRARRCRFAECGTDAPLPKTLSAAVEIAAAACFAFLHRYLGFPGALNALFAHLFLRLCYKKTSAIWTNAVAHFLYNILHLFLLW
ncbi:MAG: CPBP family glutamic-type intramembrane protease [Treponema sp.]